MVYLVALMGSLHKQHCDACPANRQCSLGELMQPQGSALRRQGAKAQRGNGALIENPLPSQPPSGVGPRRGYGGGPMWVVQLADIVQLTKAGIRPSMKLFNNLPLLGLL